MQIEQDATGVEVASLPFRIQRDKHGVEHKIIDFTDERLMPKTGQIIYEANKKSDRLVSHGYYHAVTRDKDSDVLIGIFTGIDGITGNLRFLRMTLGSLNTFDLSIRSEREKAIVLKYSNIVEGSPNLSSSIKLHLFRVHDSEKQATVEIQKIMDGQRALSVAMGLYGEDLINMARNIGVMPETSSLTMLTAAVYRAAKETPKDFLNLWDNPNRELITILKRSLETGVVAYNIRDGYTYEGRPLGLNEPMVLDFLTKYRDIATTLDYKSKERIKQGEKAMAKAPALKTTSDVEMENAILRKQLADMQEQFTKFSVDSIRDEQGVDPTLQNELDNKLREGAVFKLKGLHHYKPTRESLDKFEEKLKKSRRKEANEPKM